MTLIIWPSFLYHPGVTSYSLSYHACISSALVAKPPVLGVVSSSTILSLFVPFISFTTCPTFLYQSGSTSYSLVYQSNICLSSGCANCFFETSGLYAASGACLSCGNNTSRPFRHRHFCRS